MDTHPQDQYTSHSEEESVREMGDYENMRGLLYGEVHIARQYLDRVENVTRKTVFSESCFIVRVSFCPKLSIYL